MLVGATGLIGSHLLGQLLRSERYDCVIVVARQAMPDTCREYARSGRLVWQSFSDDLSRNVDDFFCALGTTQKVSGKAGLEWVDHDLVVQSATRAVGAGASLVSVVSAHGASSDSLFFYSRVKGNMEQDVQALKASSTHFWQPSVLLGNRGEFRLGEALAGLLLRWPFPLNARARAGSAVASAMLAAAAVAKPGCFRYKVSDIDNFNQGEVHD